MGVSALSWLLPGQKKPQTNYDQKGCHNSISLFKHSSAVGGL
jgi:hypothetical protein